jgi:DNA-binding XRE family transcriptional regulator
MHRVETVTAGQIRAARSMLGWSQEELAQRSGVARRTITSLENDLLRPLDSSVRQVRRSLEAAGILFVGDGNKVGVLYEGS